MSEHRTVLVESISYRGTDGDDHIAFKGDKITVGAEGVAHFDFIHNDTPEFRAAETLKAATEAEKAAKPAPAKAVDKAPEK